MSRLPIMLAACAALSACSGASEPDADTATDPAAGAPEQTAEQTLDAMPADFQGRWDFAVEDCSNEASEMGLTIEADRVSYYESSAIPETITQTGPGSLTVQHRFSGEGDEWQETLAYELSEDGDRLTVTTQEGDVSIRMRCPE